MTEEEKKERLRLTIVTLQSLAGMLDAVWPFLDDDTIRLITRQMSDMMESMDAMTDAAQRVILERMEKGRTH